MPSVVIVGVGSVVIESVDGFEERIRVDAPDADGRARVGIFVLVKDVVELALLCRVGEVLGRLEAHTFEGLDEVIVLCDERELAFTEIDIILVSPGTPIDVNDKLEVIRIPAVVVEEHHRDPWTDVPKAVPESLVFGLVAGQGLPNTEVGHEVPPLVGVEEIETLTLEVIERHSYFFLFTCHNLNLY